MNKIILKKKILLQDKNQKEKKRKNNNSEYNQTSFVCAGEEDFGNDSDLSPETVSIPLVYATY